MWCFILWTHVLASAYLHLGTLPGSFCIVCLCLFIIDGCIKKLLFCGKDFKEATLDRLFPAMVSTQENQFSKDKRFIFAHNVSLFFTCSIAVDQWWDTMWWQGKQLSFWQTGTRGRETGKGPRHGLFFQGMPIVTHLLKRPHLLNLPSYCGSMEVNPLIR